MKNLIDQTDQSPVAAVRASANSVQIRGLSKNYGEFVAVDDVNIDVNAGEFVALLGPSGSGKTTILMTVAGFETPDAGTISVGNEDITFTAPNKRNLGMVFQHYTLFPHMNVLENIAFPLKMRGIGRAEREQRARGALATVRLGQFGERYPTQLSGGQQQRVAIARAIVYEPRVLLMDEPLSALDKNLREEMQIETKHLQKEIGITVIFVTHDQTEAMTMADRVAVLDHGKLQQIGNPQELYEEPLTEFVAGFLGETNFFEGKAAAQAKPGENLKVVLGDGSEVFALASGVIAKGCVVRVAVRPERIAIAPAGGLRALVQESVYTGNATTILLSAEDDDLRIRIPSGSETAVPPPGAIVGATWEARHARAFKVK